MLRLWSATLFRVITGALFLYGMSAQPLDFSTCQFRGLSSGFMATHADSYRPYLEETPVALHGGLLEIEPFSKLFAFPQGRRSRRFVWVGDADNHRSSRSLTSRVHFSLFFSRSFWRLGTFASRDKDDPLLR